MLAKNKILRLMWLMENTVHSRRNSKIENPASLFRRPVRRNLSEDESLSEEGSFSDGGRIQHQATIF